jgi:hypothetical protein
VTFLKLPATAAIREEMMLKRVYQDIVLPISTLEEAIDKVTKNKHKKKHDASFAFQRVAVLASCALRQR